VKGLKRIFALTIGISSIVIGVMTAWLADKYVLSQLPEGFVLARIVLLLLIFAITASAAFGVPYDLLSLSPRPETSPDDLTDEEKRLCHDLHERVSAALECKPDVQYLRGLRRDLDRAPQTPEMKEDGKTLDSLMRLARELDGI
jgi:hypothetical protein